MREHDFTLILTADPDEEAADRLYGVCDDGTLATIAGVPRMHFHRAGASLEAAIREVLAMVLISPDFLYLLEPRDSSTADEQRQPLTSHQLA